MNQPPNQSCSNCISFVEKPILTDTQLLGFCCNAPPTRIDKGAASFPTVSATTWCRVWNPAHKPIDPPAAKAAKPG